MLDPLFENLLAVKDAVEIELAHGRTWSEATLSISTQVYQMVAAAGLGEETALSEGLTAVSLVLVVAAANGEDIEQIRASVQEELIVWHLGRNIP